MTLYYEDETLRIECDSCSLRFQMGVPTSVSGTRIRFARA